MMDLSDEILPDKSMPILAPLLQVSEDYTSLFHPLVLKILRLCVEFRAFSRHTIRFA